MRDSLHDSGLAAKQPVDATNGREYHAGINQRVGHINEVGAMHKTGLLIKAGAFVLILFSILTPLAAGAAEDPANAFNGLVPGQSTREDVTRVMGPLPPALEADLDYTYPSKDAAGLSDRLLFSKGKIEAVMAASTDPRYPSRDRIVALLGNPETMTRFQTQEFLEYAERGLRFICDSSGKTTGTVYFVPRPRRVPETRVHEFDLRTGETAGKPADIPADFRAGAAQVSIAPEKFDNLTEDAKQKPFYLQEDVLARVAVFERGGQRVVFAGLDVFLMGPWDLAPLRESLAKKGFPNVYIAMSHTHSNVDTMGFYGYYPAEYADRVMRQTEAAVLKAAENLQPVKSLLRGSMEMPLAGGRVVDQILNWRDPAVMDPTVSVIQAVGADGKPILNLVHLTCHPEVVDLDIKRGISPDFVGTMCNEITRELGGQTVFLNGALGGMVSPDTRQRTYEVAAEFGKGLAKHACAAARNAKPMTSCDLWVHRTPVEIPVTTEALAGFLAKAPKGYAFTGAIQSEMNVIWLGDAQFITAPGEVLPQIGIEIKAEMTGALKMVLGLTNDEFGYIIPSYDYHETEYEERTGPGREAGDIVTKTGIDLARMRPGN